MKVERLKKHTRLNTFFLIALFLSFKIVLLPYCLLSNEPSSGHYYLYKKKTDQNWQTVGGVFVVFLVCLGLCRKG